jgi:hypothetical protein
MDTLRTAGQIAQERARKDRSKGKFGTSGHSSTRGKGGKAAGKGAGRGAKTLALNQLGANARLKAGDRVKLVTLR